MAINREKVDLLIQYSLLAAGDEDNYHDRQLGPIHIIKYVYLADLIYAKKNDGQTFTGTEWQFYKFGPWSQDVHARIEPALNAIHASKIQFSSDYEDRNDWVRWFLHDDELLDRKQREIPPAITMELKREIHKYGKDTPSLLDHVYRTPPMLSAAPNEILDFSLVITATGINGETEHSSLRFSSLSNRKQKDFKQKISALRKRNQEKDKASIKLICPVENPRYDEVFTQGVSWLESLAGDEFSPSVKTVEFSEEVWKSSTRKGHDVS